LVNLFVKIKKYNAKKSQLFLTSNSQNINTMLNRKKNANKNIFVKKK